MRRRSNRRCRSLRRRRRGRRRTDRRRRLERRLTSRCPLGWRLFYARYNPTVRRRLFAITSLLSLLLCVGAVVVGHLSVKVPDTIFITTRHSWIELHAAYGDFVVTILHYRGQGGLRPPDAPWFSHATIGPVSFMVLAADIHGTLKSVGGKQFCIGYDFHDDFGLAAAEVGYGWVAALCAVLPAVWALRWRSRRVKARQNLCPTCSYNLTGNTSGVCPECGRAVKSSTLNSVH